MIVQWCGNAAVLLDKREQESDEIRAATNQRYVLSMNLRVLYLNDRIVAVIRSVNSVCTVMNCRCNKEVK